MTSLVSADEHPIGPQDLSALQQEIRPVDSTLAEGGRRRQEGVTEDLFREGPAMIRLRPS